MFLVLQLLELFFVLLYELRLLPPICSAQCLEHSGYAEAQLQRNSAFSVLLVKVQRLIALKKHRDYLKIALKNCVMHSREPQFASIIIEVKQSTCLCSISSPNLAVVLQSEPYSFILAKI